MFQSHGQAQQVFRTAAVLSFHAFTMLDKTMRPAQTCRMGKDLYGSADFECVRLPAFDLDGQQPAESGHLSGCDLVSGMRRQTWIVDGLNLRMFVQELRNFLCVFRVGSHAIG